jgi:hypothetical protein
MAIFQPIDVAGPARQGNQTLQKLAQSAAQNVMRRQHMRALLAQGARGAAGGAVGGNTPFRSSTQLRPTGVHTIPRPQKVAALIGGAGAHVGGPSDRRGAAPSGTQVPIRASTVRTWAWQQWQHSSSVGVRSRSFGRVGIVWACALSPPERTTASICHAEGREFESLHPLFEGPGNGAFLFALDGEALERGPLSNGRAHRRATPTVVGGAARRTSSGSYFDLGRYTANAFVTFVPSTYTSNR